jgi:hypothetical protein
MLTNPLQTVLLRELLKAHSSSRAMLIVRRMNLFFLSPRYIQKKQREIAEIIVPGIMETDHGTMAGARHQQFTATSPCKIVKALFSCLKEYSADERG